MRAGDYSRLYNKGFGIGSGLESLGSGLYRALTKRQAGIRSELLIQGSNMAKDAIHLWGRDISSGMLLRGAQVGEVWWLMHGRKGPCED